MRLPVVAIALSLSLLTACSSGDEKAGADPSTSVAAAQQEVDDAWTSKLEEAGVDADVAAVQEQAAADCQLGDEASWIIALAVAPRTIDSKATAVGVELLCPEESATYEAAQAKVDNAADPKALACRLPADDLDMSEQATLQMVC